MLSIGMGGFTLLAVGASVALGYPTAEVSRALGQSVSSLLLAVLLAVLYPAFQRFHRAEVDGVPIQAIWVVIGVSGALVVLFMLV